MTLPMPSSPSGAGVERFEIRVSGEGFRTASRPFTHLYSAWDYGSVSIDVELVRQ
jgi:hypothetical protein